MRNKQLLNEKQLINSIIEDIHLAFGDVPFPNHCGWHAAIAIDDWIDDPITLEKITKEKDIKDKWWNIPSDELGDCYMAQCYLDAKGVEFYLPAYLVIALRDTSKSKYYALTSWLLPPSKNKDYDLYLYFLERFSKIDKIKRQICLRAIAFIQEYKLDETDYSLKKDINNILQHDFWLN